MVRQKRFVLLCGYFHGFGNQKLPVCILTLIPNSRVAFGCRLVLSYRTDPVVGMCLLLRRWYWTHLIYGVVHHPRMGERASTGRYGSTWCTVQICFANCRCELRLFPEESRSTSCGAEIHSPAALPRHCGRSLGVRCSCRMKKGPFL